MTSGELRALADAATLAATVRKAVVGWSPQAFSEAHAALDALVEHARTLEHERDASREDADSWKAQAKYNLRKWEQMEARADRHEKALKKIADLGCNLACDSLPHSAKCFRCVARAALAGEDT